MSTGSIFDPNQILDAAITTELKKRPLVTPGVYTATIGEPKIRSWQGKKDPTKSGWAIDIPLDVQLTPQEVQRVGQPTVRLTDGGFLDITDGGGIDMAPGRNRVLRTYYDAVGINRPGATPRQLQGRQIKVQVGHDVYEGEPVEEVKSIAKA